MLSVHLDAAGLDHTLRLAATGNTCAAEDFGNAVALRRGF
ncbi:hypothetical protein ROBYS_00850 [Roseobacter sp. OBYS 0001]|nr:hypothetical protein ROBYS_00850 [Roseobacter sp. OBYS 0001]